MAAEPILARLRARYQAVVFHTHTSPSVTAWPSDRWVAHRTDYLPLPTAGRLRPVLAALRPDLIVLARGDLWPALIRVADEAGTPVAIVAGGFRSSTRRGRGPGRWLTRRILPRVAGIGVPTVLDAERWIELGAAEDRVVVTGDPRDQYLIEAPADPAVARALCSWRGGDPCLVAGSVEPSDLAPLGSSLRSLAARSSLRFIFVPHDPTPRAVAAIVTLCRMGGLPTETWDGTGTPAPGTRALVVRVRGCLRDVYRVASVAYVGGGFRSGGLHSVAEPMVYGIPTAVGPGIVDSLDARFRGRGAWPVDPTDAGSAMGRLIGRWLDDPVQALRDGVSGRSQLVDDAADRSVAMLEPFLRGVRDS